jgi:hypothetical protein
MKRLLLMLMVMCGLAAGAGDDPKVTDGFMNGRGWLAMTDEIKTGFIVGFYEGIRWGNNSMARMLSPTGLNYGEVSKAVDMFYKEPTNALIVIPGALTYVTAKASGRISEAQLKELEATLRDISQPRK